MALVPAGTSRLERSMGEHIFKVFLTELQTVREACRACKSTMEIKLENLDAF